MLYINGEWRASERKEFFTVLNPATSDEIGEVANAERIDAEKAVDAASKAFATWSQTTAYERSKYLSDAYYLMLERKEEIAQLMSKEQGKPLKASRNEVQYGADFLLWFAEEAKRVYGEIIPSSRKNQRFISIKQPVGVVGAITPWNYPVSMLTRKLGPALAAGCTVVLKPAEETPLCAKAIIKLFHDVGVPKGVVNLLSTENPEEIGDVLLTDRRVKKITFTGSTVVGKKLAARAAEQVKSISMELGGHAPFLVLKDADPEHAAKGVSLIKYLNTGQACISPNRIFVHESVADEFLAVLKTRVEKLKAGSGLDETVTIGPLVNKAEIEKVDKQVKDAKEKGATVITGGTILTEGHLNKGNFYAPTILSGITEDMKIYREETFGPVAPIVIYNDDSDIFAMANDTNFGLAAYVYTENLSEAMHAFEALNFGIIGINDINPTSAAAPFGGMNESGLGREGAREGIEEYLETKLGGIQLS